MCRSVCRSASALGHPRFSKAWSFQISGSAFQRARSQSPLAIPERTAPGLWLLRIRARAAANMAVAALDSAAFGTSGLADFAKASRFHEPKRAAAKSPFPTSQTKELVRSQKSVGTTPDTFLQANLGIVGCLITHWQPLQHNGHNQSPRTARRSSLGSISRKSSPRKMAVFGR